MPWARTHAGRCPVAAGLLLAVLTWLTSRAATARFSPLVLTGLLITVAAAQLVATDRVLARSHLITGDLLSERVTVRPTSTAEPWLAAAGLPAIEVWQVPPAARSLGDFLHGRPPTDRSARTITRLVSDEMPPLEDLVIAGHPRRVGSASGIAVIVGGLFLIYRRMVSFRVPAMMVLVVIATIAILPVPIVVGRDEILRRWLVMSEPRVGLATGFIFTQYLLFASPTLLIVFFFACRPGIRPLGGRAAMAFAVLFGVLAGVAIVFVSVDYGPLLALAVAQLLSPTLERRLINRPPI